MGRRSRRSRTVAIQKRIFSGKFANKKDDEEDSCYDLHQQEDEDPIIDILLGQMGDQEFENLVGATRELDRPKWYARAGGYHGDSRSTISRKRKKTQETLDAVPMRKIESYFGNPPVHQDDQNAAAIMITAPNHATVVSLNEAKREEDDDFL